MTHSTAHSPSVAIACGGTGGHLFPGIAVARQLAQRGCRVTLVISQKEVDRQAVRGESARGDAGMFISMSGEGGAERTENPGPAGAVEILELPAIGLTRGRAIAFVRALFQSYRAARRRFRRERLDAALAMGGFTSAPPVLAAKWSGARTFLHESNTIPGRANRWLAPVVDHCFLGFPEAANRLRNRHATVTGTPVRDQFRPGDAAACRRALGLDPDLPVLLVTGGSQGASAINELIVQSLPAIAKRFSGLQMIHLTGPLNEPAVREACAAAGIRAKVQSFCSEMELALGAATVALSRAGASSLAELAAMAVPAVLIPFPFATDNHQWHNARAFAASGAARLLDQRTAAPETLVTAMADWIEDRAARERAQLALSRWHVPDAAQRIAEKILSGLPVCSDCEDRRPASRAGSASRFGTRRSDRVGLESCAGGKPPRVSELSRAL